MSCGRPCPGVDVQIVDTAGISGQATKPRPGWWHAAERQPVRLVEQRRGDCRLLSQRFFRTGDIGRQDSNGYFYILDRAKDMIVTGGENVYSGEVERAIFNHPAVREVAVFGIPDAAWGELVAACVVLKAGTQLHRRTELIAYCLAVRRELQGSASNRLFRNGPTEKRLGQGAEASSPGAFLGRRGELCRARIASDSRRGGSLMARTLDVRRSVVFSSSP